ncbi:MAG: FAD-dependent oxidoreductase [Oscillospiraceae bacterium]|nr:FAD-dependent oxidoreductase [Oscillospiraceae bacterium]
MKNYDVVILGGGTAGALAAVSAARGGAKTLVVERKSHLGGTAVYGIPFLGLVSGCGEPVGSPMTLELLDRLRREGFAFGYARGAHWNTPERPDSYEFSLFPFDPEGLKYVLQEMVCEVGAEVLYGAMLSGARMEGGCVREVDVCHPSGRETLAARIFLDCSGDANLTFQAGGRFLPKRQAQNSSILFHLGGVDLEAFRRELDRGGRIKGSGTWHTRVLYAEKTPGAGPGLVHMAGHLQPFDDGQLVTFTAVSLREGEVYLNATRVAGVDGTDTWQVSLAELEERRNVMELCRALKRNMPGFQNAALLQTSPLGIRESRNIEGDYVLRGEDVLGGAAFPDGVARGAYPSDVHDPMGGPTQFRFIRGGGSYEIPFRSLLPVGLDNVIVAGRCLSADQVAHGTARIMGCCLSQGEAAGTAAACCIRERKQPRQLDGAALKKMLLGESAGGCSI